jgi:Mce-associated membrane protein
VPPPRRNANAQQPVRRPRVAGLRRPTPRPEDEAAPPADERVSGRLPVDETPVEPSASVEVVAPEVIGAETAEDEKAAQREFARVFPEVEPAEVEPEPDPEPPARQRKPAGERLAGAGQVLARLRPRTVLGPIVMVLVAAVLTATGFWLRGEAGMVLDAGPAANKALADTGATTEVITQVTRDMETVSSYKYTDLAGAQKAGQAVSSGKFLDDYNKLFEQVKSQAPAQKAVVTGQVAKIGVRVLQGDDAILVAFLTQTTTRADTNKSSSVGLVYTVTAHRSGGKWLISELTPR